MATLLWGPANQYTDGVDRGVIYAEDTVVVWPGLTKIDENVDGGEVSSIYFDGVKTMDMESSENFSLAISAFTYPDEVEVYELGHQVFGFSYRTEQHLIHMVYNATLSVGSVNRKTTAEVVDPTSFEWTLYSTPTEVPGAEPTAHLVVDISVSDPRAITDLEKLLYGDDTTDPRFPSSDEVVAIFSSYSTLTIIDHGDGTWTAIGPDDMVKLLMDDESFEIDSPSVVYVSEDTYNVSNY